MINRRFDISIWSRLDSRWIPFGICGESKLAELEAKGWTIKAMPIESVDAGRSDKLAELDRLERDVEARTLSAVQRVQARKAIRMMRLRIAGGQ